MQINVIKIYTVITALLFAFSCNKNSGKPEISGVIKEHAVEISDASSIDRLIEKVGDKSLVLLGEASHGTSEFYIWRDKISRRLIEEKGFSFIVVEGDWSPCFEVNLYIKGIAHNDKTASEVLKKNFKRWPPWMWANSEVAKLVEWLRDYNSELPLDERVGFYGMDVYGQWVSIDRVKKYLQDSGIDTLQVLEENYKGFTRFAPDEWNYARAVAQGMPPVYSDMKIVTDTLRKNRDNLEQLNRLDYLNAKQNSIVAKNAEEYYRLAILDGPDGWNSRVYHMEETVWRLFDFYGENGRGIVWAHNTHIGDARATSMAERGQVNIGQLAREKIGEENVFSVGFSTFRGTVKAGYRWGLPGEVMTVPEGISNSYEYLFNKSGYDEFLLLLDDSIRENTAFNERRGHRAIGVVYDPAMERFGNYVPTILPRRYDALIFIKETEAVSPL